MGKGLPLTKKKIPGRKLRLGHEQRKKRASSFSREKADRIMQKGHSPRGVIGRNHRKGAGGAECIGLNVRRREFAQRKSWKATGKGSLPFDIKQLTRDTQNEDNNIIRRGKKKKALG